MPALKPPCPACSPSPRPAQSKPRIFPSLDTAVSTTNVPSALALSARLLFSTTACDNQASPRNDSPCRNTSGAVVIHATEKLPFKDERHNGSAIVPVWRRRSVGLVVELEADSMDLPGASGSYVVEEDLDFFPRSRPGSRCSHQFAEHAKLPVKMFFIT